MFVIEIIGFGNGKLISVIEWRIVAAPTCIFPLRLGWESICTLGFAGEPGTIPVRLIPTYINHWKVAGSAHRVVEPVKFSDRYRKPANSNLVCDCNQMPGSLGIISKFIILVLSH